MRRLALLLMGPTGAGKSEVALALAARLPLEIVSVDSAQVYRGMDIGTAKPDLATRQRIPHHLIDIRDPSEPYSAGDFLRDLGPILEQIWSRGRQPLLVGGTMLYFKALTSGLAQLPEADPSIRAAIEAEARERGWDALHRELASIDPAAAARIHANDPQRIQRALEVFRITGEPITHLQARRSSLLEGVETLEFALAPKERSVLHRRIETRFDAMLAAGFLEEAGRLYRRGDLTAEHPSMRAVGYRQAWRYWAAECALDETRTQAIVATRQLAKRQLTWLRARPGARWLDPLHQDVAGVIAGVLGWGEKSVRSEG